MRDLTNFLRLLDYHVDYHTQKRELALPSFYAWNSSISCLIMAALLICFLCS